MPAAITRLAPSPTGALHLGNARTFLLTWAIARRNAWKVLLRIEDLDGPRVKPDSIASCIDTLAWLGIDWDQGPLIQSHDLAPYVNAMRRLAALGLAYPSTHSRTEIEDAAATLALSAPQEDAHDTPFPASLRPHLCPRPFDPAPGDASHAPPQSNWRFVTPDTPTTVVDAFAGTHSFDTARIVGDFVVWTKRDQPAYQLAVVVDDHRHGITHVVRGDDLLDSAARQLLLYRALNLSPEPNHLHLPLVKGPDGKRLAKRHGDTRVGFYRDQGVPADRVIGLLAFWSGLSPVRRPMSAPEFRDRLDLTMIPKGPVTFTQEDHQWLLQSAQ
ncbi:MAG: glutamate--tRNA ligase family protein [Planctomycetota bacterium]